MVDNRSAGERVPGGLTSPNMPMLSSSFRSTKRQRIHRIRRQNLAPTLSTSTDSNSGKSSSAGSGNSQQNSPPNPFPMCPSCFIRDNDPRLTYIGPWTLSGTQLATSHSTTRAGSSFSLAFNGNDFSSGTMDKTDAWSIGSGIIVFGTVPVSNSSDPPPEAVYHIDGQAFSTTLPFATVDVPNQPLFASSAMLNNSLHSITVNITAATSKPYIFQSILIFPNPGPGNKDAISSVPSPTSTSKTSTSSSVVASSTNGTAQAFSPGNSHTAYDPQKTIGILAGLLGTLVFIVIFAAIVFVMSRRRSLRVKQNASAEADSSSSEKGRAGESKFILSLHMIQYLLYCPNQNLRIQALLPQSQLCATTVVFGRLSARLVHRAATIRGERLAIRQAEGLRRLNRLSLVYHLSPQASYCPHIIEIAHSLFVRIHS